jgi:hypothetical protein
MKTASIVSRRENAIYPIRKFVNVLIPTLGFVLSKKAFAADDATSYASYLASILEAKEVIAPTKQFVDVQAYDRARSNAQYILNELQFQKNVKNLIQSSKQRLPLKSPLSHKLELQCWMKAALHTMKKRSSHNGMLILMCCWPA